jgi:hypothetical protein
MQRLIGFAGEAISCEKMIGVDVLRRKSAKRKKSGNRLLVLEDKLALPD